MTGIVITRGNLDTQTDMTEDRQRKKDTERRQLNIGQGKWPTAKPSVASLSRNPESAEPAP